MRNLAYAHVVCYTLKVHSDTPQVVGSPMAVSIPGGWGTPIFSYIHWFKIPVNIGLFWWVIIRAF